MNKSGSIASTSRQSRTKNPKLIFWTFLSAIPNGKINLQVGVISKLKDLQYVPYVTAKARYYKKKVDEQVFA